MNRRIVENAAEWDAALASIPYSHVLQSWAWGEIKARHGWTATRILWSEAAQPVAAAQILRRPLPRTPYGILYLPKGPALDYDRIPRLTGVLQDLQTIGHKQRAIFIKIDPDIRTQKPAATLLPQHGWRASSEQIQFHNTVTLGLTRSEDEILAAMKPKWRYNIRLAERKGVHVELSANNAWEPFYRLYQETSARDGFLIRPFQYYRDVWETMTRAGHAILLSAHIGSELVAGIILFYFGARAWYFYGASSSAHRDYMPNHLLQWQAIRHAKSLGCRTYDFWGAPDQLVETAPMYGVYKFKMGFGGEFVERTPAHDYVLNAPLYWLYAVARPRYLARLRRSSPSPAPE